MTASPTYTYWVVRCKNKDCRTGILLYPIGPTRDFFHYILNFCRNFREECPHCHEIHSYSLADVDTADQPPPPKAYRPSAAFLAATTPELESQPGGTTTPLS